MVFDIIASSIFWLTTFQMACCVSLHRNWGNNQAPNFWEIVAKEVGNLWENAGKAGGYPVERTADVNIVGNFSPGGMKMTTVLFYHEVEDGERWANAWQKGTPGNRHEGLFAGVATIRTFRDLENHNLTGGIMEVPDMEKFQAVMASDEAKEAGAADGVKYDTLRVLVEFTP